MAIQLILPGLSLPAATGPSATTTRSDLWHYPHLDTETLCAHACALGAAGEALVDSLLLRYGLIPLPVPPGFAADRLVLCAGHLLRLQVKTTSSLQEAGYCVNAQRGYRGAPQGRRDYGPADYDILAIVVLPEMVCRFSTDLRSRHRIAPGEIAGLRADPRASLAEALLHLGLDPDPGDGLAPEETGAASDPGPDGLDVPDDVDPDDLALPPVAA